MLERSKYAYIHDVVHIYDWYVYVFNSFGADVDKSRHKGPGAEVH